MGGVRIQPFTVTRDGREIRFGEITVNYTSTDAGARADANIIEAEKDAVARTLQGLLRTGDRVTGDSITIIENDSDLRTPPTLTVNATIPIARLFAGAASVVGGPTVPGVVVPAGANGLPAGAVIVEGTDLAYYSPPSRPGEAPSPRQQWRRGANGVYTLDGPPARVAEGPNPPNPNPNPPPGDGNGSPGPVRTPRPRRTHDAAPVRRGPAGTGTFGGGW